MENIFFQLQWRDVLVPEIGEIEQSPLLPIHRILECSCTSVYEKTEPQPFQGCDFPHAMLHFVSDGIIELDTEGIVTYCNDAAQQMYCVDYQAVGQEIDSVFPIYIKDRSGHPTSLELSSASEEESVLDLLTERFAGMSERLSMYFKNTEDNYQEIKPSLLIRSDALDSVKGYILILKALNPPVRERHEASPLDVRWHHLFETYPEPIAVIQDSKFLYVNAACAELYGASHKGQLIGKTLFEFTLAPYHAMVRRRLEILASGERTSPVESRIRRMDGQVRYVRTYSVPIEYAGQKAAQIVTSDITEQKRALRALDRSEKRFKALFERAGIGIVLATHDSRILETNPSFQRMVGYSADELKNMSLEDITHEEDLPIQVQFYRQIHEGKIDRYRLEKRYIDREGRVVWGGLTMAVIRDESGAVAYMIGMVENISDRKRTEAELMVARNKAEEMMLLKSSFLTNMSHEIRTPLTGIMGFAAILQDEVAPAQVELVRLIEQSGQRLLKTLDAILDLSMLESGTMPFEPRRINVVDEVFNQVHHVEKDVEEKELYIKVDYQALNIFAFLDRDYLERILSNLIRNAIKFTRKGGVTITLNAEEEDLVIQVSDTGVGISEPFFPFLFEAFRQESTGKTRTYEGTGLGLAIVKRLVEHMGGEIHVESALSIGSTFRIVLPGVVVEQQDRTKSKPMLRRKTRRTKTRPSVLVLDDNQDARRLLQKFLEGGYHVELVGEEKDALEVARQQLFDVVLMDINLGGERTGVDALRALRHLSGYEQVPVVALTAYAVTGDRERFLSHGFDGYLGKPLTKQDLYNVIANVLES